MSKIKMRCTTCGKWFQSANAKEVTCPDCVQKARKSKLAAKTAPPSSPRTPGQGGVGTGNTGRAGTLPPPPRSKPATSGTSHWFDSLSDVKVSEPEPPPQRPRLPSSPTPHDTRDGAGTRGPGEYRGVSGQGGYRGPAAYHNAPLTGSIAGGISQRPRQPLESGRPGHGPRPGGPRDYRSEKRPDGERRTGRPAALKKPKAPPPPRPKKEKIPPPEPFKPTPEQILQVETRYKELAVPTEFDGIRTQIAGELSIPKKAVKQIIKALRERESIPSWWETQTYKGNDEEKARILALYQPYLPVPPVGVHRIIADQLDLKPGTVYQAIKAIRIDLNLPPYNDPELHTSEFEEIKRKAREAREAREAARAAQTAASAPAGEQPPADAAPAPVSETSAPDAAPAPESEQATPAMATHPTGEREQTVE